MSIIKNNVVSFEEARLKRPKEMRPSHQSLALESPELGTEVPDPITEAPDPELQRTMESIKANIVRINQIIADLRALQP